MKKYLTIRKTFPFFLFIVLASVICIISGGTAKAAYPELPANVPYDPNNLQFINLADADNDGGDSGGGAWVPESFLKLYSTGNGAKQIRFDIVERSVGASACSGFKIRWALYKVNSNGEKIGGAVRDYTTSGNHPNGIPITGCTLGAGIPDTSANDYAFMASDGDLVPTSKPGQAGVLQGVLKIWIADTGSSPKTATLRMSVSGGGKLGYAAGNKVTVYPSLNAEYHRMSIFFRPPCGLPAQNQTVHWWDDDVQTGQESAIAINGSIFEYDSFSSPGTQVRFINPPWIPGGAPIRSNSNSPDGWSGSGALNVGGRLSYTYNTNKAYELRIDNVSGANGIQFLVPYDSGDFWFPCPVQQPVVPGCEAYRQGPLADHVRWRFTIFHDNAVAATGGPAEGTQVASGNQWTWKSFNQGYDHQQQVDGTGTNNFEYQYQTAALNYVIYVEAWVRLSNGNWGYTESLGGAGRWVEANCYNITCDVNVYSNVLGRNNSLKENNPFNAFITVTNHGRAPIDFFKGTPLIARGSWLGDNRQSPDAPAYPSANLYGFTAPGGVHDNIPISASVGYPGRTDPMATCSKDIDVYGWFDVTPTAGISAIDSEDPRQIVWEAGGSNATGNAVTLNWSRQLFRDRGGAVTTLDGVHSGNSTFGSVNETRTYNPGGGPLVPGTLQRGDRVCAWSSFGITNGWVGPGNDIAESSAKGPPVNPNEGGCNIIADKPYVRGFGADVLAGGGFMNAGTCTAGAGAQIRGFQSGQSDRSGSGVQYAALAMGAIEGFTSASNRTIPPRFPNGLTIGNTGSLGGYAGDPMCSTNFYGSTMYEDGSPDRTNTGANTLNLSAIANPGARKQTVVTPNPGGTLTLNGMTGFNAKRTIYVDGNLVINSNIEYAGYADFANAPALAVVVRGNIYISKNVTRLDGLFVAQKRDNASDTGIIYTCANGTSAYSSSFPNDLVTNCSSQLRVNGIFVADQVKLLRTYKSLRDSQANPNERFVNSQAAEVFNYPVEMLLSPPPFQTNASSFGTFDAYDTLPPIL